MAYIDYGYYVGAFGVPDFSQAEFARLAQIASDVVDAISTVPPDECENFEHVKKAVAYEVEYLYAQGGVDAITGSPAASRTETESLDDYSISTSHNASFYSEMYSLNGIPISSLTVSLLKSAGAIKSRWVYKGVRPPYAK